MLKRRSVGVLLINIVKMFAKNMNQNDSLAPQSFKLYRGRAPWPIQLIGGLMWLAGLGLILQGIPLLLLLGAGLIPISLGILSIRCGRGLFKMAKTSYRTAMILSGLTLIAYLIAFLTSKVTPTSEAMLAGAACYVVIVMGTLYKYRYHFI
jgi:hypothetical protein